MKVENNHIETERYTTPSFLLALQTESYNDMAPTTKTFYKIAFSTALFFLSNFCLHAVAAQESDSMYTPSYIINISFSEPHRALTLINEMETYQPLPLYDLDNLRSSVHQNGLSMYRTALNYSLKTYRKDSSSQQPASRLNLLDRITYQYI